MLFRKKPRKKIFLTNIHYDCFDLLNYWLDAVALPEFVGQHVAVNNRVANFGQAAVANGRGKTLRAGEVVEYFFSICCRLHLIPMLTEFVLGYIITIG